MRNKTIAGKSYLYVVSLCQEPARSPQRAGISLRSKANFGILEGFLSELLHDDIHILEILDGESNQETRESKFNRVDIKVRNQGDKRVLLDKAGFAIDTPVTIKVMDGFLTLTTEQLATNS